MEFHLKDILFIQKITEEISISPLCLQDEGALYHQVCQEYHHFLPWCPWIEELKTLSDVQSFLRHYTQQLEQDSYFRVGIYHNNHLIGWVSAFDFDWIKGHYKLGYWIASPYQKKGYVLYTNKFMISLLSQLFNLRTIYILCKEDNYPSRLLAHRLQAVEINFLENPTRCLYKINL